MPQQSADDRSAHVRLILGDPVVTDPDARAWLSSVMGEDGADVDLEIVRLPGDGVERIFECLSQVGMFATGRCVWVRGLSPEPAQSIDALLDFLESDLPAESALVATAPKLDQRTRLFKWFRKHGEVVDLRISTDRYGRFDGAELEEFVVRRIEANRMAPPTRRVLERIAARLSGNAGEIAQEIDRLCLAASTAKGLTAELVDAHLPDRAEAWVFDLTDAIAGRRFGDAVQTLERLMAQGESPLRLLAVLGGRIAELNEAARRLRGIPSAALDDQRRFAKAVFPDLPETVRAQFGNNGFRAWHAFRAAAGLGPARLRALHRALVRTDLRLKSSNAAPLHLFTALVQEACAPKA